MEARTFTRDQPANSIEELVAYLKGEHSSNSIYRGQTKDYGSIIPSIFRKMDLKKDADYFLLPVDHGSSRLETLKATILYMMTTKYGNVVGPYLAQQYLASSGCIDITEEVNVAAFFATMSHPEYSCALSSADQLGVIYRFDKEQFVNRLRPTGAKDNPFSSEAKEGEYEVFTNLLAVEHRKTSEFNATDLDTIDLRAQYYLLEEHIMSFSDVKPFLDELDENNRRYHSNISGDWSMFSRPRSQSGGIIQPKLLCRHPKDDPQFNYENDIIGFEDIYLKYGMTTFYFRHQGGPPGYLREELWPSMSEDGVFGTLCVMLRAVKEKGMLGIDAELKDLVDIGYLGNQHLQFSDEIDPSLATLFARIL